ncbi:MAG: ATP-binding protein [Chloroflexi bacterium]|nr:ATP-binding protein [Chloroflexota bacterium]
MAELKTGEAWTAHNLKAYPMQNIGSLLFETFRVIQLQEKLETWQLEMATVPEMPKVMVDWSTLHEALERLIAVGIKQGEPTEEKRKIKFSVANRNFDVVEIVVTFSTQLADEAVVQLSEIMTNEEPDLLKYPEHGPSLYIAKGYVELHNGKLIFSKVSSSGFHFVIQLPIYQE